MKRRDFITLIGTKRWRGRLPRMRSSERCRWSVSFSPATSEADANRMNKEQVGMADWAFVAYVIIILAIPIVLTCAQIYTKSPIILPHCGRHGSRSRQR